MPKPGDLLVARQTVWCWDSFYEKGTRRHKIQPFDIAMVIQAIPIDGVVRLIVIINGCIRIVSHRLEAIGRAWDRPDVFTARLRVSTSQVWETLLQRPEALATISIG